MIKACPHAPSIESCETLTALQDLLEVIDMHNGHGMPSFTDRAMAYLAIFKAQQVLKTYGVNPSS